MTTGGQMSLEQMPKTDGVFGSSTVNMVMLSVSRAISAVQYVLSMSRSHIFIGRRASKKVI